MTAMNKVVGVAATLMLALTLASAPAKAQFAGLGGGTLGGGSLGGGGFGGFGGGDMMTQIAPMMELMKSQMGKRRFARLVKTMGPMASQMMQNGSFGGAPVGGFPGGFAGGFGGPR